MAGGCTGQESETHPTFPQCRLPALPLPKAATAHRPEGLSGAAAATRPPTQPFSGAHPGRTPIRAPASALHGCGPQCGAHPAAPPPGEALALGLWVWAGAGLVAPQPATLAGGPGSSGTSSGLPLVSPHLSAHGRLSLQGTVVFNTHVPALGRYAFLLHSYQPAHPTFPVEVLINGGRVWQGEWLWPAVGDSSW